MPQLEKKVVACVDFEVYATGEWWTAAFVAISFAPPLSLDAEVLVALEIGSPPEKTPDPVLTRFWEQHSEAREYNSSVADRSSRADAERQLVEAFCALRAQHPTFLLVGDNISFDIPLLDALLAKYGEPPSSWRNASTHLHPVCTWSYRLALGHSSTPVCFLAERSLLRRLETRSLKHTPLFDCASALTQFFRTLQCTPHSKLTRRWKPNGRVGQLLG